MDDVLWTLAEVVMPGGARPRLDGVSVSIQPGVTAVLGASGAGKSSLLHLLVGFEEPETGLVRSELPEDASLPVYWSPQEGGLWPHMTALQHLEAVSPEGGAAEDLLESFDLSDCAGRSPGELSAGECARLSLARALAAQPAVVVLDEPLAHVDRARRGRFWRVVRRHVREEGRSLVFATHSPELVLSEADRVVCLREGRLLYEGTVTELYEAPATREQAECLGEVNWLMPEEASRWMGSQQNGRRCYRPEHLAVEPTSGGPLLVTDYRFRGPVAETRLEHTESGRQRTFLHRATHRLREGQRVALRVLCVLMLLLAACGDGGPAGNMPVQDLRAWTMPRHELSVPGPRGVAVAYVDDAQELYVLDRGGRVVVFDPEGQVLRQWNMPKSRMGTAEGICVTQDGRVAVADTHYFRLLFFDREGRLLRSIGKLDASGEPTYGSGEGEFMYPVGVAQDADGFLYVCEYGDADPGDNAGAGRVQKFTAEGEHVLTFGESGLGPGQFQRPAGVTCSEGQVYVADGANNRVSVFTTDGEFLRDLAGGADWQFAYPYDVAFGPKGRLFVAEWDGGRVTCVTRQGKLIGRFGSVGRGIGQFHMPWGIDVDRKGRVYVADTGNSRIVEIKF
jgi:ABC-type multidrug transport system ATPase subunit/DNA-binding beta-propeller fold protein YncE